ncbi:hypothetical protein BHE74_00053269 [Ensete ventricosum]|nr:hypothetical protein GW17_00027882 [Ensete ventricosum]RWW41252.1 hypothetical protein BHE74_00053269 [Ensete ventricosum]RZS24912.1 hypothetical protein BHM03_00058041 [Ensete ventricosum]
MVNLGGPDAGSTQGQQQHAVEPSGASKPFHFPAGSGAGKRWPTVAREAGGTAMRQSYIPHGWLSLEGVLIGWKRRDPRSGVLVGPWKRVSRPATLPGFALITSYLDCCPRSSSSIRILVRTPCASPASHIDSSIDVVVRRHGYSKLCNVCARQEYLFGELDGWTHESVALADDGGMLAAADGVHHPVGVVVVHYMEEAPSAPARGGVDKLL